MIVSFNFTVSDIVILMLYVIYISIYIYLYIYIYKISELNELKLFHLYQHEVYVSREGAGHLYAVLLFPPVQENR